mmetsp:Transcript_6855/g.19330  ORF Transcript_6855/g.19330 Transcript_6855/m.19330 type:complete len:459 (+) Transcript_6855:353-1729(+)|eukprot:CAMPEP_0117667758 /NCGR_PEP_ID=MMETSP0804-20121206/11154_1 /TAXON_ID=1074897 /ORGANISM="Tetraselmis astigmatica, Strain CCMP880" /LENGTH=458 /DNA_ID=CAMNT_0005475539 /DNA_START=264 /DNA_END=1640 /DNA_ORIENTATION=+
MSEESTSYGSYLLNLGASAVKYCSDTVSSLVNYDGGNLDVVDPNAEGSKSVTQIDANDQRQSFFMTANFSSYVGMDITSLLSVPVWIMEPFTVTQKMAEIMEYTELLDKAAECEDPVMRHAYMSAFLVSPHGCMERTHKPFNPILGETFQYSDEGKFKFFAEQVSHHPPVAAARAEGEKWTYDIVSAPKTKFLGNSVEIYPIGRTRIRLTEVGETYSVVPPHAKANNIVVGSTWIDMFGDLEAHCIESGYKTKIHFNECGWFGQGRYTLEGHVINKEGTKVLYLSGKWNSHLDAVKCDEDGEPLPEDEPMRLWKCSAKPGAGKYNFTSFANKLNRVPENSPAPLKSDSRRRPDRSYLLAADNSKAGEWKHVLEERQRAEKRERTKRGESWAPRWFQQTPPERIQHFDWECSMEQIAHWEAKPGLFSQAEKGSSVSNEEVEGKNFCPWQYPELPTGEAS